MFETIVSLFSTAKDAYEAYKTVTGLIKGDPNTKLLEEIARHNQSLCDKIERLSDNILYAPNLRTVEDINRRGAQPQFNGREVREYLEPVQRALQQPILSSAIILTPEKMQKVMRANPWDVLLDVRPLDFFSARLPPEGVPVQFEHGGMRYMGWQNRGALPLLFDCELHDLLADSSNSNTVWMPPPPTIITPNPLQAFKDRLKSGGEGLEMVVLPTGTFQMGGTEYDSEKPIHAVRISQRFAMGKYPVTFDDYDRYCKARRKELPKDQGWGRGTRPVINVNWQEANDYCEWLSIQTGRDYMLPSESLWEYACRAGTQTRFSCGDQESLLGRYAWFSVNSDNQTHPVGEKRANAWGLYDMQGNVWEWCADCWHDSYKGAPDNGAVWETGCKNTNRLLRGGSWNCYPIGCRPAYRGGNDPDVRYDGFGFRICCLFPA